VRSAISTQISQVTEHAGARTKGGSVTALVAVPPDLPLRNWSDFDLILEEKGLKLAAMGPVPYTSAVGRSFKYLLTSIGLVESLRAFPEESVREAGLETERAYGQALWEAMQQSDPEFASFGAQILWIHTQAKKLSPSAAQTLRAWILQKDPTLLSTRPAHGGISWDASPSLPPSPLTSGPQPNSPRCRGPSTRTVAGPIAARTCSASSANKRLSGWCTKT
jgi:hypothetical protein